MAVISGVDGYLPDFRTATPSGDMTPEQELVWPQILRLLRADITVRARRSSDAGLAAMAATLHSTVTWRDNVVEVQLRHHGRRSSAGAPGWWTAGGPGSGSCTPGHRRGGPGRRALTLILQRQ
jgi:hypothetical protein